MDEIGERLGKAMEYSGMKPMVLGASIGKDARTIRNYKKDGNKIPSASLVILAKRCNVSSTWLLTGEGDMELDASGTSNYGHSDMEGGLIEAYQALDNETRGHFYHLMRKMAGMSIVDDFNVDFN